MNQRVFLFQLQLIDKKIDGVQKRISEIENPLSNDLEISSSINLINQLKEQLHQKKLELNSIEFESQTLQKKIKSSQDSLYDGSIKNSKELQSIQTEIISLKNRLSTLEDSHFQLLVEFEEIEINLNKKISSHENLLAEKDITNSQLLSENKELQQHIKTYLLERNTVIPQITASLLQIYENFRKSKNNIAISTIVDDSCSACGNTFSPAEIQKIKSSIDEFYCQICGRIVYFG